MLWFAFAEESDAAASAGSVKRCSSVRWRAPWCADVAEDAAGADRGELLIITDQADTGTAPMANWTAVSRDKVSAMPASSMINNVVGPTVAAQSGRSP